MSGTPINEILGPKLPTRVLDVGVANCEHISLIESNGQHGNFCALSYCWGPKGAQTMITTRDNIKDRFNGIRFDSLPKTFQDAVIVTREIGIRYLWIDSLCIIQGDKIDWARESAKMAEIYQKAYLVIAASGAENPAEGCFSNNRRCPYDVKVPYYSEEGSKEGFMRLSVPAQGQRSPTWGPLSNRGWTLQEACLARRILHFMPAGMTWKCGTLSTGERYEFDLQYPEGWERILQAFSDRELTYKGDRLAALKGLGRAVQEATHDKYNMGIFESALPEQLLWMTRRKAEKSECMAEFPSWSWVSKGGPKSFWTVYGENWQRLRNQINIEPSGVLKVEGFVAESNIRSTWSDWIDNDKNEGFYDILLTLECLGRPSRWIVTSPGPARLTGIAIFDDEEFTEVHILFLMLWKGCYDWIEPLYTSNLDGSNSREITKMTYVVLLLRPSLSREGCFERVGMGFVILSPEDSSVSASLETIRLV